MSNIDHIDGLLAQMGPLVPMIQEISRGEEDGTWEIGFGDDDGRNLVYLALALDEERGQLVLGAMLGDPAEENRDRTYREMLTFNGLWAQTGGMRVARDGDGRLILLQDVAAAGLQVPAMEQVLQGFAQRALVWQALMAQGGIAPDKDGTETDDTAHMDAFSIRV